MIEVEYVGGPVCGKREMYAGDTKYVKTMQGGCWHLYEITERDGRTLALFVASRKVRQ